MGRDLDPREEGQAVGGEADSNRPTSVGNDARNLAASLITPDVERVLRAMDERLAKAERELKRMGHEVSPHRADAVRLHGKANGVALARSYIADALRGVL